jgi:predicted Zn-dependent peptidase
MTITAQLPPLAPFAVPRPFDQHAGVAANGLRIHAIRQAAAPLVTVQLSIPFGVDSPEQTGIAELLAATLFTGTADLDRSRLEDEIALVGGALRCSVDPERLTLSVTVLTEGLPSTLAIIARCLIDVRYAGAELDRERNRLIERVKLANATPRLLARQLMYRHCFPAHPISRQIPEIEHVLAADADAVRILSDRNVVPDGATLLLVGDIEPARAVDAAAAAFEPWQAGHPATRLASLPAMPGGGAVEIVERPEFRHAAVRMAAASVGRRDPGCASLYLANLVLGGYFSSRLNTNLRERDGFVYGVQSLLLEHAGAGMVVIEFDTAASTAQAALDRAVADLTDLAEHGPSQDEADRARRYATGALSLYLTTREGIVDTVSKVLAAGLNPGWIHEHLTSVSQLPDSEIARAARDFLAPERFSTVIVTNKAVSHQGSPDEGE